MKSIILFISAAIISLPLFSQTARINFKAPIVYPEGVAFDKGSGKYFVSSVKFGTIGTVDAKGEYVFFYEDTTLKSTFGIKIDSRNNKLWICSGDPTYSKYSTPDTHKKLIRLIGIDIATRKKTDDINLSNLYSGKHFLNDLTIDNDGNKYLTDSYSPVIYKVDASGKASVFLEHPFLKGMDVGINGIVWNNAGYLLVANGSEGTVCKIMTADPQKITRVKIPVFFPGADGLLWDNQNNLVLVQNKGVNKVFTISSKDDWASGMVTSSTLGNDRFSQPSTSTIGADGKVYILNSKLNELSDPTATPSKEFSIQVARFVPVK